METSVQRESLLSFVAAGAISTVFVAFGFAAWLALTLYGSRIEEPPQHPFELLAASVVEIEPVLHEYLEVVGGCGPYFDGGDCVQVRTGPSEEYRIITQLRYGVVLEVAKEEVHEGHTWYKIAHNEWLRYPERVRGDWYVSEGNTRTFFDVGARDFLFGENASSTKLILIDRSDQKLYAYEGEKLFTQLSISTGIQLTPTPRGVFRVYKKTPSRYMQGPLPGISEKYYDLPGVPWNLYFTEEGGVIHGAYWHDKFGSRWSNGCVNLPVEAAHSLYEWADVGTQVFVRD